MQNKTKTHKIQTYKVGSRTFSVSRPVFRNGLPEDVVSAPTLSSFRRRLNPFLFQQSWPDVIM